MFVFIAFLSFFNDMEIKGVQQGDTVIDTISYEINHEWSMEDFIGLEVQINGETANYLDEPPFEGKLTLQNFPEGTLNIKFLALFFGGKTIERSIAVTHLKHVYQETVHLVQIPVTFEKAPRQLEPSHFQVLIGGDPQPITEVWGVESPLELVILLDTSGSMVERLPIMRILIKEFISELNIQDRVKIIGFYHQVYEISDFTNDHEALTKSMLTIKPGGDTNLYGALWAGIKALEKAERRRAILLLTDGRHQMVDHKNKLFNKSLEACLTQAKKHMIPVYVLGIGFGTDPKVLKDIAVGTGGRYFQSSRRKKIREHFKTFLTDFQQQFVLGYYHENLLEGWQDIQISFTGESGRMQAFPDKIFIQ